MRGAIAHLTRNRAAAVQGGGIECIHQMRVALRQLNATLMLFEDVIASPKAKRIADDLQWLTSILGSARDWDVCATQTLTTVGRGAARRTTAGGSADEAAARRVIAHRAAMRAIRSRRSASFVRALELWLAGDEWCAGLGPSMRASLETRLVKAARPWLRRSARKARRAGKHIKRLTPKRRHRLRIALKQLRYDTDALSSLYPRKKVKRYGSALRSLQDVLGDLNDLVVARRLLGSLNCRNLSTTDDRLRAAIGRRLTTLVPAWHTFQRSIPFWE